MAVTLRIVHLGTEPLDGVTPLPAGVEVVNNPQLGIGVVTLQPGIRFGRLDPGIIPYIAGQQSSLILRSCTVLSAQGAFPGGATIPGAHRGCPIQLSAPDPGGGVQPSAGSRNLAILGPPGGNVFTEMGIIPLFSPVPIPPGHELRFDTTPDEAVNPGENIGPHIVQMTFDQAIICKDIWESQPCCPPGTQNCPVASVYTGPNSVPQIDPPFNAVVTGLYFDETVDVELVPQGGGSNLTIASEQVVLSTQITLTGIDPGSGVQGETYDLVISKPGCPDATIVGVLDLT